MKPMSTVSHTFFIIFERNLILTLKKTVIYLHQVFIMGNLIMIIKMTAVIKF